MAVQLLLCVLGADLREALPRVVCVQSLGILKMARAPYAKKTVPRRKTKYGTTAEM